MEGVSTQEAIFDPVSEAGLFSAAEPPEAVVLVAEQADRLAGQVSPLCDYLGIRMEQVRSPDELVQAMRVRRPIAILSEADDGVLGVWHVVEAVAAHDPTLPTLVVTGQDRRMRQVVDGVAKLWHVSGVQTMAGAPRVKDFVEFLFRAGLRSGIEGLLPA
jgi:hypothetical protein